MENKTRLRTGSLSKIQKMDFFSLAQNKLNRTTNGAIRKCFSRAFQWMVMSVGFDNLKYFGQFLCPALGDRSHHQSLKPMPCDAWKAPPRVISMIKMDAEHHEGQSHKPIRTCYWLNNLQHTEGKHVADAHCRQYLKSSLNSSHFCTQSITCVKQPIAEEASQTGGPDPCNRCTGCNATQVVGVRWWQGHIKIKCHLYSFYRRKSTASAVWSRGQGH
jgi:hypothetical protein